MKKNYHYLKYYNKFKEEGSLPTYGLCPSVPGIFKDETWIMTPSSENFITLSSKGMSTAYWAGGMKSSNPRRSMAFTSLRQTILLFCAAINNEL